MSNSSGAVSQLPAVAVFADGSSVGNPGPGGYAAILECRGVRKELAEGFSHTTGSRMEVKSVIAGLEALKSRCRVLVRSGSQYAVNGINRGWARRWRENGWKRGDGERVANIDLWERLLELCEGHEVKFEWKHRNSLPQLRRCEQLAHEAAGGSGLQRDPGYAKKAA